MDDPFLYFDQDRRDQLLLKKEHQDFARDFATKTTVLLKNENKLLPLNENDYQKIAVIGPLSNSRKYRDYQGNWNAAGQAEDVVTLYQALQQRFGNEKQILQHDGCEAFGKCPPAMIKDAVNTAKQADIIICAVGENGYQTGEGASRADISLPGNQEELLQALHATGKPVVMAMFNGRPLIINWAAEHIPAILEVWQPGIMGGPAIADLLFGDANPSGKLPVSFPRSVGQIPVYYAHLNTGRPKLGPEDDRWGVSKYSDVPNEPLFPFGFGLTYTTFNYSNLTLDKKEISFQDTLQVSVTVTNTGKRAGEEVVQLYIRDLVAQVSRTVKQLKRFKKINLEPGESKNIAFQLTVEDLKYWNGNIEYVADRGEFKVFVGPNSADVEELNFKLK
ncbi:MAG: glycoside hydrolase family 3 C-terminal domain-containing protein [Cyclobacteriaceae bacterium]